MRLPGLLSPCWPATAVCESDVRAFSPAASNTSSNSAIRNRLFIELMSVAPILSGTFRSLIKQPGVVTPVPTRKEQIGSVGASCHIRFVHQDASGPLWQRHTVGSSRLASHPARFAIATERGRPAPGRLPPPYNNASCHRIDAGLSPPLFRPQPVATTCVNLARKVFVNLHSRDNGQAQ
jgi:hypothetical protein